MPTYDYECQSCGHRFERFHAPDVKHSKTCPVCRKRRVERQIGGGAGVIFKGSGFYETDYRRKAAPQQASETPKKDAAASSPGADGGSKGDTAKGGDAKSGDSKSDPARRGAPDKA